MDSLRLTSLGLLMALAITSCRSKLRLEEIRSTSGFPTFRVECRNDTEHPIERVHLISALQFDGTLLKRGSVGDFLGGPPAAAPPGSSWSEVIVLTPPTRLGYGLRDPAVQGPLLPGQHTVAFRCAGLWSEDIQFEWQPDNDCNCPDRALALSHLWCGVHRETRRSL
jgi:hypothetical protein